MKSRPGKAPTAWFPGIVITIVLATNLAGAAPAHAGLLRDIRRALFPPRTSLENKAPVSDDPVSGGPVSNASIDEAAVSPASMDSQLARRPTKGTKRRMTKTHMQASRHGAHRMHKPKRVGAAAHLRPRHPPAVRMARLAHRLSPQPLAARPATPHSSTAPLRPRIATTIAAARGPHVLTPVATKERVTPKPPHVLPPAPQPRLEPTLRKLAPVASPRPPIATTSTVVNKPSLVAPRIAAAAPVVARLHVATAPPRVRVATPSPVTPAPVPTPRQPRVATIVPRKPLLVGPRPQPRIAAAKLPAVSLPPRSTSAAVAAPTPHAAPAPALRVPAPALAKPAPIIVAKTPPRAPLAPASPALAKAPPIALPRTQRIASAVTAVEPSIARASTLHWRALPLAKPQTAVATEPPPEAAAPADVTSQDESITEGGEELRALPMRAEPEPTVLDHTLAEFRVAAGIALLLGAAAGVIGMWWLWSGARVWDARQRRSRRHQSMIDIFPAGDSEPALPPLKCRSPERADLSF